MTGVKEQKQCNRTQQAAPYDLKANIIVVQHFLKGSLSLILPPGVMEYIQYTSSISDFAVLHFPVDECRSTSALM